MEQMSAESAIARSRRPVGSTGTLTAAMLGAVLPALRERHGAAVPRDPAPEDATPGEGRGSDRDAHAAPSEPVPNGASADSEATKVLAGALALTDDEGWRRTAEALLSDSSPDRVTLREWWLAPLARRLGEAWREDEASLADVTIGLGRLQWLLDVAPLAPRDGGGPRVVLAPTPGDGHVFGLSLLAEELREAGFAVELHGRPTAAGVGRAVSTRAVAVLGIGVSVTRHAGRAAVLVRAARRAARSTRRDAPLVIAGGAAAGASAALLRSAGVDEIMDGCRAPGAWLAERLDERGRASPRDEARTEVLEIAGAAG